MLKLVKAFIKNELNTSPGRLMPRTATPCRCSVLYYPVPELQARGLEVKIYRHTQRDSDAGHP